VRRACGYREPVSTTGRRIAVTCTAGALAVSAAALLLAPTASRDVVALGLALMVVLGAVQGLTGLGIVVVGGSALSPYIAERTHWGAGWVLDGVRSIGMAVAVWTLFSPDAGGSRLTGWLVLAAVLLVAPVARRLDRTAAPRLTPGTYVVRVEPVRPTLPESIYSRQAASPVPLRGVPSEDSRPSTLRRIDQRL